MGATLSAGCPADSAIPVITLGDTVASSRIRANGPLRPTRFQSDVGDSDMVMINPIQLPRRLQSVPDLGPYEIHVGALSKHHVDQTMVVRQRRNLLTGPLLSVPTQSMGNPSLLVVQIGDFSTALHPSTVVMIIPDGYQATVSVAQRT